MNDESVDIAIFDPEYCAAEPMADKPGMWRANYAFDPNMHPPFVPVVFEGDLRAVAVFSPEIKTKTGIHIGSTRAELFAAYPHGFTSQLDNDPHSTVNVVAGQKGQLMFEVSSGGGFWDPPDLVKVLTVIGVGDEVFPAGGGGSYFWGTCVTP